MIIKEFTNWDLYGSWPHTPLQSGKIELGEVIPNTTGRIKAEVPGSVYQDLLNAGLIEDPYFGMNSLYCEWVANRWWTYETTFEIDDILPKERLYLVFCGIDYAAHIYLNGEKIGNHVGMYTRCEIDITKKVRYQASNRLTVVLEHAPDEMSQAGYTSLTHTQKARFNYKWDFGTRLVNLGLYGKVYLEKIGLTRIQQLHLRYIDNAIHVGTTVDSPCRICAECFDNGVLIAREEKQVERDGIAQLSLPIADPKLWYPNGSGEQPLYDVNVTAYSLQDHSVSDEKTFRYGLKTVEYVRCDGVRDNSLPYSPVVNGKRIFLKGVNLVPLDHMYGCVRREDYQKLLLQAKQMNVNLIRVWGGGLIESEEFYEICDSLGLMVWQEMIQSSSGLDNTPSKDKTFMRLLAATAESAVTEKRNHVCLTYWSGGNELMDDKRVPYTYEDANIAMLKEIINRLDPDRLMLPASASGPLEYVEEYDSENNHDVHGNWTYEGEVAHYDRYNRLRVQLHSEFGVDGMSCLKTLKKILPEENLRVTDMKRDLVWRHHGEWWDTYKRDTSIFGNITSLSDFIKLSQYMQAEGLRYIIESHRRRAFRTCGCIVWQLNEPWPNVCCTNMIEYDGTPKMAAYYYRDAMKPLHVSLQYDKLIWKAGEIFRGTIVPLCDDCDCKPKIHVRIEDDNGVVWEKEGDGTIEVRYEIPVGIGCFRVVCKTDGDTNTYLFPIRKGEFADPRPVISFYDAYMAAQQ